ncbi:MAG: twin-arginine translocase subunit TatC, partial [Solirubrobacterales bacterium]|nr:twin-arginine translocase subunit TatC [Solirubrobacterales bacterium]
MPRALRPIGHEDRLTLVDHLDELRRRLVISISALIAAFSFCFWQNNAVLDIVTKPVRETQNLQDPSKASKDPLEQAARFQREQGQALRAIVPALALTGDTLRSLSGADNVSTAQQRQLDKTARALALASRQVSQAAQALPRNTQRNLVTLGVTEPFTATITLAFYGALLLAMPFLLYQAYAFILPAFSPQERKTALPLMLMVPVLFIAGVLFGYFVVLTRAVEFLQNFNDDSFDILLQAKEYFKFAVFFLAGIGLLFQIPVGVLAVTRLGIFTPKQLAKNRGYIILAIAVLAAVATPTPDPITMTLAMAPLIILFELSILLARWIDRIKPPPDPEDDEDDEWNEDDDDPHDGRDGDDDDLDVYVDPLAEYEDDDVDLDE